MAKLFLTQVPTEVDLEKNRLDFHPEIDSTSMRSHLLLRKISTDLETNLDAFLSRYNLSPGRFTLLLVLRSNRETGMMPSELAHTVGVTQATISGLINTLEKAELVERTTHEKDGRAFVIRLTSKGHETVGTIAPEYYSRLNTFWAQFSQDEKKSLNGFLEKMITNIQQLGAK
ncbi:Transcriptional repressor MprA [compost metagenome]